MTVHIVINFCHSYSYIIFHSMYILIFICSPVDEHFVVFIFFFTSNAVVNITAHRVLCSTHRNIFYGNSITHISISKLDFQEKGCPVMAQQ